MEIKYDYKKLNVYIESKILVKMVYLLLKKFPKEEQYALCDQLRRAVISVPSNISEGFGRFSSKEQVHFFEIAYGSLREVDCQMDIACDLEYISSSEFSEIEKQINKVSAILSGIRNKRLKNQPIDPLTPSPTNPLTNDQFVRIVRELGQIPDKIERVLGQNKRIADFAKTFTYAQNFIYLGRGYNYPVAMEGALKLKEISYIHAEGYPAAEMKHGPIALISQEMPVVVVAPHCGTYEKVVSNIQEIKARKGRVIAVVTEGDELVSKIADYVIEVPETEECLTPLLTVIPLQLLAYHIAVVKGCDVDQPRNLAKSVTVE